MNSNGNTDDEASSVPSKVPSKDSSSDTKPIASKDNKYPNVNAAFPNGILNSTETTLSETQFHLDGKVTDVGADGIGNYHTLITAKHDSTPKYLLVVDHKKTGKVILEDKISLNGSATGLGSVNNSQIDAGLSEQYHGQKVAYLNADKVKIN